MKTAILILSDPKSGDEALGRAFNALALAQECIAAGDQVEVTFVGAGTRWPGVLSQLSHPANGLYSAVREVIVGGSCGCAAVFGATESLQACGIKEVKITLSTARPVSQAFATISPTDGRRWCFDPKPT